MCYPDRCNVLSVASEKSFRARRCRCHSRYSQSSAGTSWPSSSSSRVGGPIQAFKIRDRSLPSPEAHLFHSTVLGKSVRVTMREMVMNMPGVVIVVVGPAECTSQNLRRPSPHGGKKRPHDKGRNEGVKGGIRRSLKRWSWCEHCFLGSGSFRTRRSVAKVSLHVI